MTSQSAKASTIGIDIGKNTFHLVGMDASGAIVLRQNVSRGQLEKRFANLPGRHGSLRRCAFPESPAVSARARLMPAIYVKPRDRRTTFVTPKQSQRPCNDQPCGLCRPNRSSSSICRPCTGCGHAWFGNGPL